MVSWDMKAKFLGHSPHINELVKLAKEQGFSNIEGMKQLEVNEEGNATYYLMVNNRGAQQKEFKSEITK